MEKCLNQETKKRLNKTDREWNVVQKLVIAGGIIGAVVITGYLIVLIRKREKKSTNEA